MVDGADDVDVLRHLDSLVRKSLVVADHTATRTRYSLFETIRQFAEDRLAETGALERARDRHAAYFAREAAARWEHWNGPGWRDAVDWVEAELGNLRSGYRWSAATRRPRGRDRHRRARRADGLLGAAVRDARLGRGAARARDRGRRPPPPPPLHRGRLRVLRGTGGGRSRERAPGDRAGGRRPLRRVRARVRLVRRGAGQRVLRRPRSLRRAHRRRSRERYGQRSGLRPRRPTSTASSRRPDRGGTRAHRGVGRRRAIARQPVLDLLRALDRGDGVLARPTRAARSRPGTRASPSCASTASSSSRASSHATRPACTPPTASPRPRSVLFADAIAAFHRAGNVPQLIITLASVPALFERLDRLAPAAMLLGALSREPSSFHHVPELADLGDRVSRRARHDARRRADGRGRRARPRRRRRLRAPADRRRPPRPDAATRARRGPAA